MPKATIYHNPKCSKSRAALALLEEHGVAFEVIKYLSETPSKAELKAICKKLSGDSGNARSILRDKEALWKDTYAASNPDSETLFDLMVAQPILIERPIVVLGNKAAIGRPTENILTLLQ